MKKTLKNLEDGGEPTTINLSKITSIISRFFRLLAWDMNQFSYFKVVKNGSHKLLHHLSCFVDKLFNVAWNAFLFANLFSLDLSARFGKRRKDSRFLPSDAAAEALTLTSRWHFHWKKGFSPVSHLSSNMAPRLEMNASRVNEVTSLLVSFS